MTTETLWNVGLLWGLGYEFDPQWLLTDAPKELPARLIQACAETLRPSAVTSGAGLVYPRANFEWTVPSPPASRTAPCCSGGTRSAVRPC